MPPTLQLSDVLIVAEKQAMSLSWANASRLRSADASTSTQTSVCKFPGNTTHPPVSTTRLTVRTAFKN